MNIEFKSTNLSGSLLDWAVAVADEAYPQPTGPSRMSSPEEEDAGFFVYGTTYYTPSSDIAQAWRIIDRERISIIYGKDHALAIKGKDGKPVAEAMGDTALIAAMRCFVIMKLGEYVYIPEKIVIQYENLLGKQNHENQN